MSAISARALKETGFTDIAYVEGGTVAWREAGLPAEQPSDA